MESMTQGDNFRKITAQWNQKKHKEGEVSLWNCWKGTEVRGRNWGSFRNKNDQQGQIHALNSCLKYKSFSFK
jgi:hypothetical protein